MIIGSRSWAQDRGQAERFTLVRLRIGPLRPSCTAAGCGSRAVYLVALQHLIDQRSRADQVVKRLLELAAIGRLRAFPDARRGVGLGT